MKVVDMHCDTISELYQKRCLGTQDSLFENDLHIDLKKMQQGDYFLQNFALFTHLEWEEKPFEYVWKLIDLFYTQMEAYSDQIRVVKSWKEIEENWRAGRLSALLTIEEGGVCLGELEHLRNFYRAGVRMMTLTWNFENELAYPNAVQIDPVSQKRKSVPDTVHGLKEKGIAFLEEMERLGMIIDISHLNDAGIWDVFRYTKKPFVASHSNARALASHPRNLTDEMLRALAERGGVAGINFCASFLRDEENGNDPIHSTCQDMIRHMKHMKQVGGISCIGLGTDFDGIENIVELKDASGMQRLADEMQREGFTSHEIEQIFYGNVLRVYRELLK